MTRWAAWLLRGLVVTVAAAPVAAAQQPASAGVGGAMRAQPDPPPDSPMAPPPDTPPGGPLDPRDPPPGAPGNEPGRQGGPAGPVRAEPLRFDLSAPPPVIAVPSTRPSEAEAATLPPDRARQLIEDLASPEPGVREAAFEAVMDLSLADLDVLRSAAMEAAPLPPQVYPLLRDAVMHVFLRHRPYDAQPDAAFLGITLAAISLATASNGLGAATGDGVEEGPVGISVTNRMPGLAGFRYLQDGDVIVWVGPGAGGPGAGGPGAQSPDTPRPGALGFRSTEEFSGQIRGRRPNERVVLGVLRSGRLVQVEARLSARPVRMEEFNSLEALRSERLTSARDYWESRWHPVVEVSASAGQSVDRPVGRQSP